MATRVISSIAGIVGLGLVMFAPIEVFAVVCFALAIKAVHEMCKCLEKEDIKPIEYLGILWCLIIPVLVLGYHYGWNINPGWIVLAAFVTMAVLFFRFVNKFEQETTVNVISTVFVIGYIVFSILSIGLIRIMPNGEVLVWITFIGAWATDSFAYLVGVLFGKTKIIPHVSPNKTVEGSIGGVFGCIILIVLYGLLFNSYFQFDSLYVILIGLLCGVFSQLGDWAMSAFKRKANIKDFGKFLPGHGGVLDRLDSIIFIAPMVYGVLCLLVK